MSPLTLMTLAQMALAAPPEVEVMPLVHQGAILVLAPDVTAGGAGGGVGIELAIDRRWLVQVDAGALWLLGQAWLTRVAVGYQRDEGWCPAGWLTLGGLWGDRVEHIGSDALRPAIPTWALGVRGAPLRFGGDAGVVSALEVGVATNFTGSLWLELTLLRAGARW